MGGMKKFRGKCKDDWPNSEVNVDAVARDKFHPIYLLSSVVLVCHGCHGAMQTWFVSPLLQFASVSNAGEILSVFFFTLLLIFAIEILFGTPSLSRAFLARFFVSSAVPGSVYVCLCLCLSSSLSLSSSLPLPLYFSLCLCLYLCPQPSDHHA